MLHDLDVVDILGRQHGVEHAVLLGDPLVGGVGLGQQLEQRQRVQQALLAQARQLRQLAVPRVDGRQALAHLRAVRVRRTQLLRLTQTNYYMIILLNVSKALFLLFILFQNTHYTLHRTCIHHIISINKII